MRSKEIEGGDDLEKSLLGTDIKEDDYNELDGEDLEGFSIKEEDDDDLSDDTDEDDDLSRDDDNNEEEEVF
jgi:hypothetical protein